MTNPSFTYKTGTQCHARINQLEALLSLPLSAEESLIDNAWLRITELEKMLGDKPTSVQPAKSSPPKADATTVDPPAAPLYGIARATAANASRKPAIPRPDSAPLTGIRRAMAANVELQEARKLKA
jgi:hypothetical protein